MDIMKLKVFFKWCTIINGSLLIISVIFCILFQDLIYSVHGSLFNISGQAVSSMIYLFLGMMKIIWFFFNVVPYIALIIVEKQTA